MAGPPSRSTPAAQAERTDMRPRSDQPTLTIYFAAILFFAVVAVFPRPVAAQAAGPDRPLEIEAISVDDLPAHIKLLICLS